MARHKILNLTTQLKAKNRTDSPYHHRKNYHYSKYPPDNFLSSSFFHIKVYKLQTFGIRIANLLQIYK